MTQTLADRGQKLTRAEIGELAGILPGSVTKFLERARAARAAGDTSLRLFPEPDGYLGRTPYWHRETFDVWDEHRLSQGMVPAPATADVEDRTAGAGDCPVCGRRFASVSNHRSKKATCSFDEAVRTAAQAAAR